MSEYIRDPDQEPEEWQEPILADGLADARSNCDNRAKAYTSQNRAEVELIKAEPASQKAKKAFVCFFRGFKP